MKFVMIVMLTVLMTLGVGCGDDSSGGGEAANNGGKAQEPECEDRTTCGASEECIDGQCVAHLECSDTAFESRNGFPAGTDCWGDWNQCADNKAYALECIVDEDGESKSCTCSVNDVEVSQFSAEISEGCSEDEIHRLANDGCGWHVPEVDTAIVDVPEEEQNTDEGM